MPAHVYMRTGNYQGALEANDRAARVDAAYIARVKPQGVYPLMYTTHNFMFLAAAAGMTGQSAPALESAAKAVAIAAPMAGHDAMAEYVLPWSLFTMARAGKWDAVLAHPRPADATPATLAFWHYARGLAHVARGALDEARQDRRDLAAAATRVPADLKLNLNRAHDLLEIASAVLDARLAAAAGRRDAAIGHWKAAVAAQDRIQYDEPPAWYYPVRESLGGEYLRTRRFREAEAVFRRDLEQNPGNPRSLFGLREALRGRSQPADDAGRRFEEAWRKADVKLGAADL
jgi:tetratricopeptide (TPR) repeat protein